MHKLLRHSGPINKLSICHRQSSLDIWTILHQRVYSAHLSDERIQFTNQRTVKGLPMADSGRLQLDLSPGIRNNAMNLCWQQYLLLAASSPSSGWNSRLMDVCFPLKSGYWKRPNLKLTNGWIRPTAEVHLRFLICCILIGSRKVQEIHREQTESINHIANQLIAVIRNSSAG